MEKLLLAAVLMFASVGTFADEFDDFSQVLINKISSSTVAVRADKASHTIFLDIKMPGKLSDMPPEKRRQFIDGLPKLKETFISKLRGSADERMLKKLHATLIYNFVTLDPQIFSVVIAPTDL